VPAPPNPQPNPAPGIWEPTEARPSGGAWNSSPWGMVGITNDYARLNTAIGCLRTATSDSYVDAPGGTVTYTNTGGNHTNLSDPVTAAGNMFDASRASVPDVMILLSDGEANQPQGYNPCQRAVNFSQAEIAANPNLTVYTIAYGVNGIRCTADGAGSSFQGTGVNSYATRMFAQMATQPSVADAPNGNCSAAQSLAENADGDYYYCMPISGSLDQVFRQIVVATLERARLIEFD
jgi:hypothetical protein